MMQLETVHDVIFDLDESSKRRLESTSFEALAASFPRLDLDSDSDDGTDEKQRDHRTQEEASEKRKYIANANAAKQPNKNKKRSSEAVKETESMHRSSLKMKVETIEESKAKSKSIENKVRRRSTAGSSKEQIIPPIKSKSIHNSRSNLKNHGTSSHGSDAKGKERSAKTEKSVRRTKSVTGSSKAVGKDATKAKELPKKIEGRNKKNRRGDIVGKDSLVSSSSSSENRRRGSTKSSPTHNELDEIKVKCKLDWDQGSQQKASKGVERRSKRASMGSQPSRGWGTKRNLDLETLQAKTTSRNTGAPKGGQSRRLTRSSSVDSMLLADNEEPVTCAASNEQAGNHGTALRYKYQTGIKAQNVTDRLAQRRPSFLSSVPDQEDAQIEGDILDSERRQESMDILDISIDTMDTADILGARLDSRTTSKSTTKHRPDLRTNSAKDLDRRLVATQQDCQTIGRRSGHGRHMQKRSPIHTRKLGKERSRRNIKEPVVPEHSNNNPKMKIYSTNESKLRASSNAGRGTRRLQERSRVPSYMLGNYQLHQFLQKSTNFDFGGDEEEEEHGENPTVQKSYLHYDRPCTSSHEEDASQLDGSNAPLISKSNHQRCFDAANMVPSYTSADNRRKEHSFAQTIVGTKTSALLGNNAVGSASMRQVRSVVPLVTTTSNNTTRESIFYDANQSASSTMFGVFTSSTFASLLGGSADSATQDKVSEEDSNAEDDDHTKRLSDTLKPRQLAVAAAQKNSLPRSTWHGTGAAVFLGDGLPNTFQTRSSQRLRHAVRHGLSSHPTTGVPSAKPQPSTSPSCALNRSVSAETVHRLGVRQTRSKKLANL